MKTLTSLLVLMLLLFCRPALAEDAAAGGASFILVNHTGAAIVSLRLSPSLTDNWGDNLLGKEQIANQAEAQIPLTESGKSELWDLQTSDPKGEKTEWPGVSLTDTKKIALSFEDGEPVVTYPK